MESLLPSGDGQAVPRPRMQDLISNPSSALIAMTRLASRCVTFQWTVIKKFIIFTVQVEPLVLQRNDT